LPEIKQYYDKGKAQGLSGADLIIYSAKHAQRPAWKEWIAKSIRTSYEEYLSAEINNNNIK
jgi:hypothetical protein